MYLLINSEKFHCNKWLCGSFTLCLLGNFACFFVVCWYFSKSTFTKIYFSNTIWVSNSLAPDQARHFVGPDLGPTVCKGYQQTTLLTSRQSVNSLPSDSFTIFGLWVLGLAVSNIDESQLQTYESLTLFLMTSLQYYCIPGLARTRWNKNLCAKDAGCAGNKITAYQPPCWRHMAVSCSSILGSEQSWQYLVV